VGRDIISYGNTDAECYAIFYGTKTEVDAKQENYLGQYHPHGYSTRTEYKYKDKNTGEWCCRMSRWHSCD